MDCPYCDCSSVDGYRRWHWLYCLFGAEIFRCGVKRMHGKVKVWYMSEEERLAYIEKYPIIPIEKPKSAFTDIYTYGNRRKKVKNNDNRRNVSLDGAL